MNIGDRIRVRRTELGWSQRELAEKMGYDHSTVGRIETGKVDIPQSRIIQFSNVLGVSVGHLMGLEDISDNNTLTKADSREAFSRNLRFIMAKVNKSRKEVSKAIGVSYSTFTEWYNGKKYPRIEKLEILAKYFEISVSELVGEQQFEPLKNESTKSSKDEVLDIVIRLHTDKEFLELAENLTLLDKNQLIVIKQLVDAFSK